MFRRILPLIIILIILTGCTDTREKQLYQATWVDVFDTVTTLRGYDVSQEAFDKNADRIHHELQVYHQLFDVYNSYEGIVNLKDVNDAAGTAPVKADPQLLDLVEFCRECCEISGGKMNAAAGSMLRLWHEAREAGLASPETASLPDIDLLRAAMTHASFDTVIVDRQAGTIYIQDPEQLLDVGAVAKGWSGEQVRKYMPDGYLLSLGGNICANGSKPNNSAWNIGIQSPEQPDSIYCVVSVIDTCVVTSGDYQRFYTVDGINYHHIIDPQTLMPGNYWRSVTILCNDSGLADFLSTALFLMPLEEGRVLAESYGVEVLWIDMSGSQTVTDNFPMKTTIE